MLLDLSDDFALDRSVHFEMTYCATLLMSFDNSSWRCMNHLSLSFIELLLFGDQSSIDLNKLSKHPLKSLIFRYDYNYSVQVYIDVLHRI